MMRRLFLVAAAAAVAAVAFVGSAGAGPSTTETINWAFVGAGATLPEPNPAGDHVLACPAVPAGMWVLGTGTVTSFAPTGSAGNIDSLARGTAVDSAGNTYRWNYHQSVHPNADASFSEVVDEFVLAGSGPVGGIRSHFILTIDGTSIEEATSFVPKLVKGNPFECDPL